MYNLIRMMCIDMIWSRHVYHVTNLSVLIHPPRFTVLHDVKIKYSVCVSLTTYGVYI